MNWRVFSLAFLVSISASAWAAEISGAWARPTAPGAKVGGVFMTIKGGAADDRVVSASSAAAVVVELHTHVMDKGVAKMTAVPGIDVPAGQTVELKPGGLHIMLINLKAPLKAGEVVPLKLRFEKAGELVVEARIGNAPAGSAKGEHHRH